MPKKLALDLRVEFTPLPENRAAAWFYAMEMVSEMMHEAWEKGLTTEVSTDGMEKLNVAETRRSTDLSPDRFVTFPQTVDGCGSGEGIGGPWDGQGLGQAGEPVHNNRVARSI